MYEWDDEKAAANFDKHGVSFEEAATAFSFRPMLNRDDDRRDYGERRIVGIAISRAMRFLTIVWTPRGENTRIISARRASREEQETYVRHFDIDLG